ncbi:MAG: Cysteinyl-tRNA synthetase [Candidatus Carbobacillus altaicus]|uniref:Cysteine--tRNA ligase n=1 Tax=Candidatus Carbonibacillus altaicus TaxID=2163959 RepID=A0A2R6Y2Y3_9BACL|nr:MAG: Cysteinyl-tRNA synthetase [Candidatus Carbobacillus altaicus]
MGEAKKASGRVDRSLADLYLYNTMSRRQEKFVPLTPGKVRMYVCGPTVYNTIHIGNGRAAVFFDTVRRVLMALGYEVIYVHNYTDVDDKIIRVAQEVGETPLAVAERYIRTYEEDMRALNVLPPTVSPRVSEHIKEIIALIQKLLEKGFAYEVGGDVYFRVEKFPRYGALSGQSVEALRAGARIEVDEKKENPLDFALWKRAKDGEIHWRAPWSRGRPGWHIECSAMSMKYLGESFDIHGGGIDLCFPHHENEIAQSEGATGVQFVRYWMHNGHVQIAKEKMSKSLGNIVQVRDILSRYGGMPLRFWYLNTHYRQPLEYHEEALVQAEQAVRRLQTFFDNVQHARMHAPLGALSTELKASVEAVSLSYWNALLDDIRTPDAITALFELVRLGHQHLTTGTGGSREDADYLFKTFSQWTVTLGFQFAGDVSYPPEVSSLLQEREEARKTRDFARADALRAKIEALGFRVEDTPSGQRVRMKDA